MEYLIGTVINNRYEIVEKIGVGGMATVYKAKCRVLGRYVAIKVLKDSLKNDVEVVKKFNTESRAAAMLSHPNIVQVYDVSEAGDLDYIVMEYVDGITLKEYIMRKGHLEIKEACDIAAQIGRALACAHANGVVHRDIKPHNVIMSSDGVVKVADFGIAQAATSETMVAGDGALGSVHYFSPEQARGGYINERSDIYSLGVVLYEMLSGEVPFDGANPVAIALAKLENEADNVQKKCTYYIPNSVCDITMKAISKDQHSRYQSAAEMVADLEKVIGVMYAKKEENDEKFETKRLYNETREGTDMKRTVKRKKSKSNRNIIILIVVAVIAVFAGLIWWGSQLFGVTPEVDVPNIVGYSPEEAEDILKKAGLKLDTEYEYDETDEVPDGMIMRQSPEAGETVKKGRAIKITINMKGKAEVEVVEVPGVVGLDKAEAERQLKRAGFICIVIEEKSSTVDIGKVIRQEPGEDETLEEGSEVTIYVSADSEEIKVPDVMGKSMEDALAELSEAGFEVGDLTEGESDDEKGIVISQTPTGGTMAYEGTKVSLMLSKGPLTEETEVPNSTEEKPKTKKISVMLPKGDGAVLITVKADGQEIYRKQHDKSEFSIWVDVPDKEGVKIEAFADGVLME